MDLIETVKNEHETSAKAGILPMESQFMLSLEGLAETLKLLKRGFPLQYNMLNQLFEEHAITKEDETTMNKTEELIEAVRASERANETAMRELASRVNQRLIALASVLDEDIVITKDDSFKITVKANRQLQASATYRWSIEHPLSIMSAEDNYDVSTIDELTAWLEEGLCPGYLANLVLTVETAAHHELNNSLKEENELKRELLDAIRTIQS